MELSEQGLWRGNEEIICPDEETVYRSLELPFIEPELREDGLEIDFEKSGWLKKIVKPEDVKGVLHNHTDYSDGKHSLEQMAEASLAAGHRYFRVADHFRGSANPRGMNLQRALIHLDEIEGINEHQTGTEFRIISGVEADIEKNGTIEVPEVLLEKLDYLVCSIHNHFLLSTENRLIEC
jgi:DNA polymerase (family 10)